MSGTLIRVGTGIAAFVASIAAGGEWYFYVEHHVHSSLLVAILEFPAVILVVVFNFWLLTKLVRPDAGD
jgi:hypothetical protein